jgi:hypothetical protein
MIPIAAPGVLPMPGLPLESVVIAASQTADYAVGWGTLTLINAGLAQSKNRSGLAWWLISLFLGPIATLLIVLLDRVQPAIQFVPKSGGMPPEF